MSPFLRLRAAKRPLLWAMPPSSLRVTRGIATLPRFTQAAAVEATVQKETVIDNSFPYEAPPVAHETALSNNDEFWRKVPVWENTSAQEFLSYRWSV